MDKFEVLMDDTMHNNKSYKKGEIIETKNNSYMEDLIKQNKVKKI